MQVDLATLTGSPSTPREVADWAHRETRATIDTLRVLEIDRTLATDAIRSLEAQLAA